MIKPMTLMKTLKSYAKPSVSGAMLSAMLSALLGTMVLPAMAVPTYYVSSKAMPFSDAVMIGNTLYMSGQIGVKDGKLVKGGVTAETKQIFDNMDHVLAKFNLNRKNLVKCSIMLGDMDDFSAFNKAYLAELTAPYPARSAFAVSELALGASVEIECLAAK